MTKFNFKIYFTMNLKKITFKPLINIAQETASEKINQANKWRKESWDSESIIQTEQGQ